VRRRGRGDNKLVGYLGVVSRHLESPLAMIVQSSSAAGKSSLMEAVLAFLPDEQRVQYSAMTGQSLFYMGETDLKHKVLAIVEEEGAHSRVLRAEAVAVGGRVDHRQTGKDPNTGRHVTHQYRVEGPVMIFLTTTAIDQSDEELLNRCLVLSVNEDREQTQAIHRVQREAQTLEGLLRRRTAMRSCRASQRAASLEARPVVNPLRARADLPGRPDPDAARPHEVPDAHPQHRPVASASAARKTVEHRGRAVEYIEVTLDRHRHGEPARA
jgi:DNA primase